MRIRRVLILGVVATVALGAASSAGANVEHKGGNAPPGYHRVTVKKAGISVAVPNDWIITPPTAGGPDFGAGDPTTAKIILVGLKKKTNKLPTNPTLENLKIAGKPAKVSVDATNPSKVATSFYLISKKGGVLILCEAATDARQDPTFKTIIKSVKLLK